MKTNLLIPLVLAFGLAALPAARGAANNPPAEPPADAAAGPADLWAGLKGHTYDEREVFIPRLKELESRVDAQISELVAKRATMDAKNISTEAWDFAMQELGRARTNLLSTSEDMSKATRENWDQQKDQVGLAWVRTQDAYAKVKASTTS